MSIKFGDEHLLLEKFVRSVYKITINEKWFYIGSSINTKRRLSQWKNHLSDPSFKRNGSIKHLLPEIETVKFEILELVPDGVWVKERENVYLHKHFNDELCLNLIPDAIVTKGRKWPMGKEKKEKPKKNPPSPSRPVAQFDGESNELIKKFSSISALVKELRIKHNTINEHLRSERGFIRGFFFKLINPDGSIADRQVFDRVRPPGRKFYQIDKEGNIVAEWYNISLAAKAINSDRHQIARVLNGEYRYKTAKGFIFKYA